MLRNSTGRVAKRIETSRDLQPVMTQKKTFRRPFHRPEKRLQSNLSAVYNPRKIRVMCTVYNQWGFSISHEVIPDSRTDFRNRN
jgi:hypothetical protein